MSDLRVNVPLAKPEDIADFGDFQCSEDVDKTSDMNCNQLASNSNDGYDNPIASQDNNISSSSSSSKPSPSNSSHKQVERQHNGLNNGDNTLMDNNFGDSFSDSLEDLVNTFDEKITNCFKDYGESVEKLAPVQVRTQEEMMADCQVWWTLTGNFGNILPIDWSKTVARRLQLPALNVNSCQLNDASNDQMRTNFNELFDPTCDEEELSKDLDMHSLILASQHWREHEGPISTAEEVLEEIDEMEMMMQSSECSSVTNSDMSVDKSPLNDEAKVKDSLAALLYEEKLRSYSTLQLNELYMEMERMVQDNSETLIQELALRDELEFEKELKNNFISLLLSIQNKRRQHHMERKKGRGTHDPKYLTTVIPYHAGLGPPDVKTIQILLKMLKAVNDDSPAVPALLTDYILKVLCPT